MSWLQIFRPAKKAAQQPLKRAKSHSGGRAVRRRPAFDALEDRCVPAVYTVDLATDESDANISAGDLSLREAVSLADSSAGPDSIIFASSISLISINALNSISFSDSSTTTIDGGSRVTLDGSASSRIFGVQSGASVILRNLTLQNGSHSNGGSAIFNNGTLSVSGCLIQNNNTTSDGAAINSVNSSTLTVANSNFISNAASGEGGACRIANSTVATFTNCTFSGNTAASDGGAFTVGGAATLTVLNSTIIQNRANSDGAGSGVGGGVAIFSNAVVTLFNTIVAGNIRGTGAGTADDVQATLNGSSANNLIGDAATAGGLTHGVNGNILGNGGSGVLPLSSILNTTLANNGGTMQTYALVQNSPALAAGSATVPGYVSFDQRNAFRDPTAPDIGAYEVQHPLAPVGTPPTYALTFQPKPSANAIEAVVKGLYQSTLLRAADPAGLAGWVALLNSGALPTDVAYGFVNSTENRTNQVTFFYTYFLGRTPDPAGLAGWVGVLQSGADEGTVMSGFLLSPEFTGQNNNASFVNLMYYSLLGRQADQAGFNSWVASLNSGALTREQVGNGFLRSIESITRVVVSDFGSYLKRTITPAAASPFVSQIQAGTTFGRVAANILGSNEFFVAAGQNLT